ncbi:MAG: hypothetical protein QXF25_00660 [Candidatus Pacearchaeota archaeon]
MEEKEHLLSVLKEVKNSLKKKEVIKLKELSNQTIHSASIQQDEISIAIAVIVYSLSKIIERTNYQAYPNWEYFLKKIMQNIERAISSLEKNNEEMLKKHIKNIEIFIEELTGNLKFHIQQVFEKAKINKASRIYEHGISMERTAKLLGITIFELAEYAGKTGISDINLSKTLSVKERIKYVTELFT